MDKGQHAMALTVGLALDALTDEELAALHLAVVANYDPRPVDGYDKVKFLFTSVDTQGRPKLHSDTLPIFIAIVRERLGTEQTAPPERVHYCLCGMPAWPGSRSCWTCLSERNNLRGGMGW